MKPEEINERYLEECVRAHGGETRKLEYPGRMHAPDRLVLRFAYKTPNLTYLRGMHWLVELKAAGEQARPGQAREHVRLRDAGFKVFVLDTIEKIDKFIEEEFLA